MCDPGLLERTVKKKVDTPKRTARDVVRRRRRVQAQNPWRTDEHPQDSNESGTSGPNLSEDEERKVSYNRLGYVLPPVPQPTPTLRSFVRQTTRTKSDVSMTSEVSFRRSTKLRLSQRRPFTT